MATFSRISIATFKELTSSDFLELIKSPKTQKLFLVNQDGHKFNVHQDIDAQGDCEILCVNDNDEVSYCLVNRNASAIRTF